MSWILLIYPPGAHRKLKFHTEKSWSGITCWIYILSNKPLFFPSHIFCLKSFRLNKNILVMKENDKAISGLQVSWCLIVKVRDIIRFWTSFSSSCLWFGLLENVPSQELALIQTERINRTFHIKKKCAAVNSLQIVKIKYLVRKHCLILTFFDEL